MRSRFIEKVWGREEIISPRSKIMHLDKGSVSSYHNHRVKEEYFYIESGAVRMHLGDENDCEESVKVPGDIIHIPIGLYHSFAGIQDSRIIETSLQDDDPADSYRLTQSERGVL
jgi:mannose-6-phosphate isomerase-like protein (cupin superfamily)